jgi:hypothetical protein
MARLREMFHTYIADLFPESAEFEDDGERKLRISFPIPETELGQRYSRSIVLQFEKYVIEEFQEAVNCSNLPRQDRIGDALCEIVRNSLGKYEVNGPRETAYKIYVDSRATDL